MGGLLVTRWTFSSGEPENQPLEEWTWPMMWMEPSGPGVMWMYPEPVLTLRVAVPFTGRVLSKVPSAAKRAEGTRTRTRMAAAKRSFIENPPQENTGGHGDWFPRAFTSNKPAPGQSIPRPVPPQESRLSPVLSCGAGYGLPAPPPSGCSRRRAHWPAASARRRNRRLMSTTAQSRPPARVSAGFWPPASACPSPSVSCFFALGYMVGGYGTKNKDDFIPHRFRAQGGVENRCCAAPPFIACCSH